jgi:hypothetical protein
VPTLLLSYSGMYAFIAHNNLEVNFQTAVQRSIGFYGKKENENWGKIALRQLNSAQNSATSFMFG